MIAKLILIRGGTWLTFLASIASRSMLCTLSCSLCAYKHAHEMTIDGTLHLYRNKPGIFECTLTAAVYHP